MKYFYVLLALVFLASCVAKSPVTPATPITPAEETNEAAMEATVDEVEEELLGLLDDDTSSEEVSDDDAMEKNGDAMMEKSDDEASEEAMEETAKVIELSAPYVNPQGNVDMTIEYTLDADDKIDSINVSATTYDLTDFNNSAQKVIGMTVEEASNEVITGGSLTDPAFSDALKNAQ